MVNKKRKRLFIITLTLSVFLEVFFILGILYTSQKFRPLNRMMDKLFFNALGKITVSTEQKEDTVILPIKFNSDAVMGIEPIFEEITTEISPDDFTQVFSEYDFLVEMNSDKTGFTLTGDLRRLSPDFISETEEVQSWEFNHTSRILSKPAFFADCIAFVDANLDLILLDIKTGQLRNTFHCGILPEGNSKAMGNSYYFSGKNGKKYRALFSVLPNAKQNLINAANFFIPDIVAQSNIFFKLESWQKIDSQSLGNKGTSISAIFDKILPIPEGSPISVTAIDKAPKLFILSHYENKNFEIKLCDENGNVVKMPSYVAVFDAVRGQLISSSLDTLSDNPTITVTLTSDALFYVAVGALEPLAEDQKIFLMVR